MATNEDNTNTSTKTQAELLNELVDHHDFERKHLVNALTEIQKMSEALDKTFDDFRNWVDEHESTTRSYLARAKEITEQQLQRLTSEKPPFGPEENS